jgi:hypothetical protein
LLARAFGSGTYPAIGLPQTRTVNEVSGAPDAIHSAVLVDMEGQPLVASILKAAEAAA